MAKNSKVGDKVRVLDADGIIGGYDLTNGKVYDVIDAEYDGDIVVVDDDGYRLLIKVREFASIEKVDAKSTKSQRITELEAQVAELEAKFEALKEALQ